MLKYAFLFTFIFVSIHAAATLTVIDTKILKGLEASGYSLNEVLGLKGSMSQASELYNSNPFYKSVADKIGHHLEHNSKTGQLPAVIPPESGDIPDMVRLLRGFEDKGSRSDKDLKGGFLIRQLSNNSQYPYLVEQDGDEPRHFDELTANASISEGAKTNRASLREVMEKHGFKNYPKEWWHFNLNDEPYKTNYFDFEVQ